MSKVYTDSALMPVLTIVAYCKWYEFQLRYPDGHSEVVKFGALEEHCPVQESAYVDHVPNPRAVKRLCEAKNWLVDSVAWDLICGRWANEVLSPEWTEKPDV